MKNVIVVAFILVFSCRSGKQETEKIYAPSQKYFLTSDVNSTDESNPEFGDVIINLFDSTGVKKSRLNTHAGDFSKWAIGWDSRHDTVILYSSDIGIFAWRIQSDSLQPVNINAHIEQQAKSINLKKYK